MIYKLISVTFKDNYAIVQLDGGKVNQINSQMAQELKHVFLTLDKDESVRGVILSGRSHRFSASLVIFNITLVGKEKAE